MNLLTQIIKVGILLFILLSAFIYFMQRHLIYFPSPIRPLPQDFAATDLSVIQLHTADHLSLNAWYKAAPKHRPTILFFHGNAGNLGHRMALARQFINAGYGFLLFDYRGYGGNKGSPSEQGFYKDGQAALRFLSEQGVKPTELVLYGESLGTGVASQLASEHSSCALILQSPFSSLTSMARRNYPWILLSPWDKFDSLSRIKKIKTPLLILHGTQDTVVPYAEGLTLFKAAIEPKQMISFPGYGHNNLWEAHDFYQQVSQFIKIHCH